MKLSYLTIVALVACGGSRGPTWQLLDESRPAMLSVWGTSAVDVWVTGGRSELAGPPVLAHYDGETWESVDVGLIGIDLWWVFGVPTTSTIFVGGSGGVILRSTDGGATFAPTTTPHDGIVFGIWGASEADAWAVGSNNGEGFAWRFDGAAWTVVAVPAGVVGRLFKVHGQSATDVWISCTGGATLHWNGSTLERVDTGTTAPLFSIITTPDRRMTVGGVEGSGVLLENADAGWALDGVVSPVAWRGIAADGEHVFAVGELGVVGTRGPNGWTAETQPVTTGDFHAAWVDPEGGLWGVGGEFDRVPLTSNGFITYFGNDRPRSVP
jgi:hypothetical protein